MVMILYDEQGNIKFLAVLVLQDSVSLFSFWLGYFWEGFDSLLQDIYLRTEEFSLKLQHSKYRSRIQSKYVGLHQLLFINKLVESTAKSNMLEEKVEHLHFKSEMQYTDCKLGIN